MKQVQSKVFTAHVLLFLADKVDSAARLERSGSWIIKQALRGYTRKGNGTR